MAAAVFAYPAQAQNWSVELNGAKAGDLSGVELGLGYNFGKGKFRLTPTLGALLYQGENDRYSTETTSNGRTICRDHRNGQFADKENCNNVAAKAYGKLEAAYRFGKSLELGAGVRVSDEITPYGALGVYASETLVVRGFAGKDYYSAGVMARF